MLSITLPPPSRRSPVHAPGLYCLWVMNEGVLDDQLHQSVAEGSRFHSNSRAASSDAASGAAPQDAISACAHTASQSTCNEPDPDRPMSEDEFHPLLPRPGPHQYKTWTQLVGISHAPLDHTWDSPWECANWFCNITARCEPQHSTGNGFRSAQWGFTLLHLNFSYAICLDHSMLTGTQCFCSHP